MKKTLDTNINYLLELCKSFNQNSNLAKIQEAYLFAEQAHNGQFRKSGEPYVTHPLAVAMLLAELKVDDATIIAALLHDVPEDTSVSIEDVAAQFGEDVSHLVEGVTKLSKVKYVLNMEQYQVDCLRKMFLTLSQDLRVVIIKLADRLHNMRTLTAVAPEKRVRIALETMEIYAPLADRLGIWSFKWELEDLCFRHLYPLQFYKLTKELSLGQFERDELVKEMKDALGEQIVSKLQITNFEVYGRAKHLYSIFRKMERKQKTLSEIYDLFAIRVIVDKVSDCYAVLGLIHEMWKPKAGRFKDYIAAPKVNGYQSLHTTVFGVDENLIEFQIRTKSMHEQAELGFAAHWAYKDQGGSKAVNEKNMAWLARLKDLQENIHDNKEFIEGVKVDLFNQRIFVFTPRGEVKDLPEGANAIDFAFAVHSNVGYRCQGAKVNGKIVRLETPLKTGDVIEVLTTKNIIGPKRDWLRVAATVRARSRIKAWFRRQDRDANMHSGLELLERELAFFGKGKVSDLNEAKKNDLLQTFTSYKSFEDLLVAIGEGEISQRTVLKKLFSEQELLHGKVVATVRNDEVEKPQVYIQGERDVMITYAKCCLPTPPAPIIGYITRGRGVTVHTTDCRCVKNLALDRLVHASWLHPNAVTKYHVMVIIEAQDRVGLLRDILQELARYNVNVVNLRIHPRDELGNVRDEMVVEIVSVDQITAVLDSILSITGVLRAYQMVEAQSL
ncbi:MAG: bifunctional (p)ppGpp synthetase/guanosine-3',5'-bis(diphosphate) 3'-pyrophosphohydrolase [Candidatus Abawacabacteria bacterium]|nr:bifunctional (p)ppGpp synthetase/guanosine-3',5'-bis(diphosphate) 3'-pyrophosphohydrolase [Candidatus Abawacabacteria bacterium]